MRGSYRIEGIVNDYKHNKLMQMEKLNVNVTKDKIGCTVSIGSENHGIQLTIPFDAILKELKKAP